MRVKVKKMNLFPVYPLYDVEIARGKGCKVWDSEGTEYLDLYGGHAVISIGHSHPYYIEKIQEQLAKIGFYSNSVKNSIQENFARYLADIQELRTGNITVGSGAMMTAYLLPGIIAAYKERYPYVEVKVTEGCCAICWPRAHWMWCWKTRRCPRRCWKASPAGGIIWCWPCRAAGPSTPSCAHGS